MNRREALKHTALIGGTAAVSSTFIALLESCMQQVRTDWVPRFLSVDHAQLVSSLVDTLLPTTDTPGGLDVKVDRFIDLVYDQLLDEKAQQRIRTHLDQFNEKCVAHSGKVFADLNEAQRKAILEEEEANSPKFGRGVWGYGVGPQPEVGFYRSFKSLAIQGYFTSEEIGKNVMNYDPIPGPFKGCIPFDEVGGVWSY